MGNKLLTAVFALTVALLACSMVVFDGFTPQQLGSIEKGMSVKQVKKILGDPALRDINEEEEVWTFRSSEEGDAMEVRVWFRDGKVVRMHTLDKLPVGDPVNRPRHRLLDHRVKKEVQAADSCCHDAPCSHDCDEGACPHRHCYGCRR